VRRWPAAETGFHLGVFRSQTEKTAPRTARRTSGRRRATCSPSGRRPAGELEPSGQDGRCCRSTLACPLRWPIGMGAIVLLSPVPAWAARAYAIARAPHGRTSLGESRTRREKSPPRRSAPRCSSWLPERPCLSRWGFPGGETSPVALASGSTLVAPAKAGDRRIADPSGAEPRLPQPPSPAH